MDKTIAEKVQSLATATMAKKLYLSTAESCTGGWISQEMTALAGSSAWFDCAFVTYSNRAKATMLGVPLEILNDPAVGAVSEETVLAMAAGAIAKSDANVAVAVSGVAGPGGGSKTKPVGTVWIAWQWEAKSIARCFQFSGDRESVRRSTVIAALDGLLLLLN